MIFCRKSLKIVLFGHNDPNTKISAIEIAIQIVPYIIKNIRLLMKALKLVPLLIVCIFCFGNICFQMEGQFSRLRSLKEFTPLMFRSSYWEWVFLLIAGCCKIKLQTQRVQKSVPRGAEPLKVLHISLALAQSTEVWFQIVFP